MKKKVNKKKKISGIVTICVNSSFNNTIITACENSGNVVAWESSGSVGFKNTKESTPFAAQSAAEKLANKLKGIGVKEVKMALKGLGAGRDSVIKTFGGIFTLTELSERTPIAYNGVRQPKRRRS